MQIKARIVWLGWAILLVACMPVSDQKPPAAMAATPTLAPTATLVALETPTPGLAFTPVPPAMPALATRLTLAPVVLSTPVQVCAERQGRLSILYLDSATLGRRIAYSIYLPPCYAVAPARVYPALYLLHGASADHTQWPDLNVAVNADSLIALRRVQPFVVVMPDGDYRPGEDYAVFVLHDLIPQIEQTVHIARDRKYRAIGGLSRGGAWALEIALTHPDQFSVVGGHSPVSDTAMKHVSAAAQGAVRIYLDVGKDDPLASGVEAFAGQLELEGFTPVFHLYPGGHDRPYWRSHTAEYLAFYAAAW